ncbi:UNKNOWN [Stylonychia lemnae]|uniref:Uncharacterized protein n=1 Tax=Stylonychia lemnae TaxID=5949 RepID=A0A078A2K7_STYLE|nr:UNKNOWN [Stylonychia lemnae]|eukprot:CDW76057.1 UNKNOWN [Stylonychia lemnae]
MQEQEIIGSTESLKQLQLLHVSTNNNNNINNNLQLNTTANNEDAIDRSTNNKSQQQNRRVIPRSKISPPLKQTSQHVSIFNSSVFLKDYQSSSANGVASEKQKSNRQFDIVEDVPNTIKRQVNDKNYEKQVIELSQMKFKLTGQSLLAIQNQQSGFVRLQQLKINIKLVKDCTIDLEIQNQTAKKRLVLSTSQSGIGQGTAQLGNDANFMSNLDTNSLYDSVSSSQQDQQKLNIKQLDINKPQSLYKITLDPEKLRGRWATICIDFDRIMPQESVGQKLKINNISIQAPGSRIYEIQAVYDNNQENQQKNTDEENIIKRQRKAYVNQEDIVKPSTFQTKKRSIQNVPAKGPKSFSLNSRQDSDQLSNLTSVKTPVYNKIPELPNLNTKADNQSMLRKGLKVIQERVTDNNSNLLNQEQQLAVNKRQPAKSAVISSQKFKKSNEENSDNDLIDPQSKGMKFIQKLTERQKRMEERYFKKDPKQQQQQQQITIQNQALPLKQKAQQKQNPNLPSKPSKMTNTASSGFKLQQNNQNNGQINPTQYFGMTQTSQINFQKSCTFSSTLRNFEYKPPVFSKDNDEVEESIQEEICQSQREDAARRNNNPYPQYQQKVQQNMPQSVFGPNGNNVFAHKPPIHNFQTNTNNLHNQKQFTLMSRDSNFTQGTLGMGGAHSTRSTQIKTPIMFGGGRLQSSQQEEGAGGVLTQYSQISGPNNKFPSASETKQDYFKFHQKDMSTARSKLLFSPSGGTNEGGMTEDEGGILSDREQHHHQQHHQFNPYQDAGDKFDPMTQSNSNANMQRYTQNVFDFDKDDQVGNDEDDQLYMVDVAVEYRADFGLQRRPFSPPFKL